MNKNDIIIKCPHKDCGCEYLVSEIFVPKAVFGKPSKIIKDPLGKILHVEYEEGEEPELTESFVCDQCGKSFVATLKITADVKPEAAEIDFTQQEASFLD